MLLTLVVAGLLAFQAAAPETAPAQHASAKVEPKSDTTKADAARHVVNESSLTLDQSLLRVKRIYVDNLGDEPVARQMRDMIINGLNESKRFIITENKEKADAILKGSGLEKTSQEFHSTSESTAVSGAAGHHSGNVSGTVVNGTGSVSGSSSGGFHASGAGISDASASTETIHEARVAVRLVNADGDVIWSTTQESKGAKYKGSSADVAEKIVKQLLRDIDKLKKANAEGPT